MKIKIILAAILIILAYPISYFILMIPGAVPVDSNGNYSKKYISSYRFAGHGPRPDFFMKVCFKESPVNEFYKPLDNLVRFYYIKKSAVPAR